MRGSVHCAFSSRFNNLNDLISFSVKCSTNGFETQEPNNLLAHNQTRGTNRLAQKRFSALPALHVPDGQCSSVRFGFLERSRWRGWPRPRFTVRSQRSWGLVAEPLRPGGSLGTQSELVAEHRGFLRWFFPSRQVARLAGRDAPRPRRVHLPELLALGWKEITARLYPLIPQNTVLHASLELPKTSYWTVLSSEAFEFTCALPTTG